MYFFSTLCRFALRFMITHIHMKQNTTKIIMLLGVLSLLGSIFSAPTFAQTPPTLTNSEPQIAALPRVYISGVNAAADEKNFVTGNFLIRNSEEAAIGNVQYEYQILDPLPKTENSQFVVDNPHVHDRLRAVDNLTLGAGETKTIAFSYQAPKGINGPYRLRIQIVTANDRELGWGDTEIKFNGDKNFLIFETKSVGADSTDPITKVHKQSWAPLTGINVDPNSPINLNAIIANQSKQTLTGFVNVNVKRFLYNDQEHFQSRESNISIKPGAVTPLTIPLVTKTEPGAYIVLVKIIDKNGNQISGVGEYRYVVRGQTASVASALVKDFSNYKGGLAEFDFLVAGSADRVTPVTGNLEFILSDKNGQLGKGEKQFKINNVVPAQGTAKIALERSLCGTPKITLVVKNDRNTVLDNYQVALPNFSNQQCGNPLAFSSLTVTNIILVIIVIGAVYWLIKAKPTHINRKK